MQNFKIDETKIDNIYDRPGRNPSNSYKDYTLSNGKKDQRFRAARYIDDIIKYCHIVESDCIKLHRNYRHINNFSDAATRIKDNITRLCHYNSEVIESDPTIFELTREASMKLNIAEDLAASESYHSKNNSYQINIMSFLNIGQNVKSVRLVYEHLKRKYVTN